MTSIGTMPRPLLRIALGLAAALAVVAGVWAMAGLAWSSPSEPPAASVARIAGLTRGAFDDDALQRIAARMDPAARALAERHDGTGAASAWGRVPGWASLDLGTAPSLGLNSVGAEDARVINAALPVSVSAVLPAPPFVLRARNSAEFERAVRCLSIAIYYEAALESIDGRRAVAQVVLNRVRDQNFPNTVCGVVFQGWERWTGCQFSFTCDGSLSRTPIAALMRENEQIARQALTGHVMAAVGTATHYHADYVLPYWSPTLSKITQIGTHIFYRWVGPAGLPQALNARYSGSEFAITDAVLTGRAPRATPAPGTTVVEGAGAVLPDGAAVTQVAAAEAGAPGRVRAVMQLGGRRLPSQDEVARINEGLRRFEAAPAPAASAPAPAAPAPAPAGAESMTVTEVNRPAG